MYIYISLVAQRVKRLPAMQETWVWSLGQEDPLEKEMATHSSILAWKIPWTEKLGRPQSMGSQRVGHDWATSLSLYKQKNKVVKLEVMVPGENWMNLPGSAENQVLSPAGRSHRVWCAKGGAAWPGTRLVMFSIKWKKLVCGKNEADAEREAETRNSRLSRLQ